MIKKPSPNWESLDYDETYSEFSIFIIYFIKVLMTCIIIDSLISFYQIVLKTDYYNTFYDGKQCDELKPGNKWIAIVDILNDTTCQIMIQLIIQFQIYEWFAMIYIIKTQRGRNVGEILFDYNNENINDKE